MMNMIIGYRDLAAKSRCVADGNPFAENTLRSSNDFDAAEMISYNPPTFYSAAIVSRAALSIVTVMNDQ